MWYVMITRVPIIRVPGIVIREFISLGRQRDRYFIDSGGKRGVGGARREYSFGGWSKRFGAVYRGVIVLPPGRGGAENGPGIPDAIKVSRLLAGGKNVTEREIDSKPMLFGAVIIIITFKRFIIMYEKKKKKK